MRGSTPTRPFAERRTQSPSTPPKKVSVASSNSNPGQLRLQIEQNALPSHGHFLQDARSSATGSSHAAIQAAWSLFASVDYSTNEIFSGSPHLREPSTSFPVHKNPTTLPSTRVDEARPVDVTLALERQIGRGGEDLNGSQQAQQTTLPGILSPVFSNSSHYASLLNSRSDPSVLLRHLSSLPAPAALQCAHFLAHRAHRLLAAADFTRDAVRAQSLEEGATMTITAACAAAGAHHATVWAIDAALGTAKVLASTFLPLLSSVPISRLFHRVDLLSVPPRPALAANVAADPAQLALLTELYDGLPNVVVRSIATAPILPGGGSEVIIGAIEVINKAKGTSEHDDDSEAPYFAPDDLGALEVLAAAIAPHLVKAISKGETEQRTARTREAVGAVQRMVEAVAYAASDNCDDGNELGAQDESTELFIRDAGPALASVLGAERGHIFLLNTESTGEIWTVLDLGGEMKTVRIGLDRAGLVRQCEQTGEIISASPPPSSHALLDRLLSKTPSRSVVCAPLRNRATDEVVGFMLLADKRDLQSQGMGSGEGGRTESSLPHKFTEEDISVMGALAGLTSACLDLCFRLRRANERARDRACETAYLAAVLNCMPNGRVIATFDGAGRLRNVNRPAPLGLVSDEQLDIARSTHFRSWLGAGGMNTGMVADLERVRRGMSGHSGVRKNNRIVGRNFALDMLDAPDRHPIVDYEIGIIDGVGASATGETLEGGDECGQDLVLLLEEVDYSKKLIDALGRVFPAAEVSRVLEVPDEISLGTTTKASVMVTDIKDFSHISEIMDGSDVLALLNEHFAVVVESVAKHGGFVDKFMGDGSLSAFGVPFSSATDSRKAVLAALRVRDAVTHMNATRASRGLPEVRVSTMIATGSVLAGLMGGAHRCDFTVVGSTVGLAIAGERAAREYGCAVILDQVTRDEVMDVFQIRELDTVGIEGHGKVTLYEAIADVETEISQDELATMVCYELGLGEYRSKNWTAAVQQFKKSVQLTNDAPSRYMIGKCTDRMRELEAKLN
ncbi:hypothetical protein HDU93_005648 [Gonapodya sp. JEL0774]|nr:hypothetical protein HDU93_005648 [Gonapodya sp. JEL0774]